jgi:hypothetical protein
MSLSVTESAAVSADAVDPLGGILHGEGTETEESHSGVRRLLGRLTMWWNPNDPSIKTFDTELLVDEDEVSRPSAAQMRDHAAVVAASKADPRWGEEVSLYAQRPSRP